MNRARPAGAAPAAMIGTAGWAIPAAQRPCFPAAGPVLARYAAVMPCVEINSSFYRPHRPTTWARWADSVPAAFRFAVKLPREISHARRLVDVDEPLAAFLDAAGALGGKLAVLLLQLPPSLAFDAAVADAFLARVASATAVPVACEPRHASWFTPAADALLADRRVARVAADPATAPAAAQPGGWRGLTYRRLHGAPDLYRSRYDDDRLQRYAAAIAADRAAGRHAWCILDNTAASAALDDACRLRALTAAADRSTPSPT